MLDRAGHGGDHGGAGGGHHVDPLVQSATGAGITPAVDERRRPGHGTELQSAGCAAASASASARARHGRGVATGGRCGLSGGGGRGLPFGLLAGGLLAPALLLGQPLALELLEPGELSEQRLALPAQLLDRVLLVGQRDIKGGAGNVEILVDRPVLIDCVLVAEHEEPHERLGLHLLTEVGAGQDHGVGNLAGDVALNGRGLDRLLQAGERGPGVGRLQLECRDPRLELGQVRLGVGQRLCRLLGALPGGGDGFRVGLGQGGGDDEQAGAQRADHNCPNRVDASPHNAGHGSPFPALFAE